MAISIVQDRPQFRRVRRRPQHPFQLRTIPYVIQPFLIAPVLPGETLENLLMQSRCVSDPVKSPLIGWWNEYYFFYIKHRDLADRIEWAKMMVDPTWNATALDAEASDAFHYFWAAAGKPWVNWSQKCLDRIVAEYFRDEGDVATHNIDGKPAAPIAGNSWHDSVTLDANMAAEPDLEVEGPDANTTIQASEIERAMIMWSHLREGGLTQQTYEEYLATYGVKVPEVELEHKPEVIRFVKDWSYPSNTVDAATGVPTSALSWSIAERADKKRFFKEPGFIYGVTVKRPKVYLSGQKGYAAAVMKDAYTWLPPAFAAAAHASMTKIAALDGPLSATTTAYWIDIKDLLMYGDQFVNFALSETDAGLVALPTAAMAKRYVPALADVQALFTTGASKYFIREDGIVSLDIAGRQVDNTARALA